MCRSIWRNVAYERIECHFMRVFLDIADNDLIKSVFYYIEHSRYINWKSKL